MQEDYNNLKLSDKTELIIKQVQAVNEKVENVKKENNKLRTEKSELKDSLLQANMQKEVLTLKLVGYLVFNTLYSKNSIQRMSR